MFPPERLRASKSLISSPHPGHRILFYNFLTQQASICSYEAMFWISELEDFTGWNELRNKYPNIAEQTLASDLDRLREASVLIAENSMVHLQEQKFLDTWEWGLAAGVYHFSLLNNIWMDPELGAERQIDRAQSQTPPKLYWTHSDNALRCSPPSKGCASRLIETMQSRRSNRVLGEPGLTLNQLTDCLYAGMAITGQVETRTGMLPLQMTPNGGARNPYEAFVLVRDVEGLEQGVYHYSASQHTLAMVSERELPILGDIIAGQPWADDKPAMILLVALFERLMWKYQDPNAYRVALIEAGHKGQNIALAATAHGLTACPTAALNHSLIATTLGLDSMTHCPIYALTLSNPGEYDMAISPLPGFLQQSSAQSAPVDSPRFAHSK